MNVRTITSLAFATALTLATTTLVAQTASQDMKSPGAATEHAAQDTAHAT